MPQPGNGIKGLWAPSGDPKSLLGASWGPSGVLLGNRKTHRQKDRRTDRRRADIQTDTDSQAGSQMDRQSVRQAGAQAHRHEHWINFGVPFLADALELKFTPEIHAHVRI